MYYVKNQFEVITELLKQLTAIEFNTYVPYQYRGNVGALLPNLPVPSHFLPFE